MTKRVSILLTYALVAGFLVVTSSPSQPTAGYQPYIIDEYASVEGTLNVIYGDSNPVSSDQITVKTFLTSDVGDVLELVSLDPQLYRSYAGWQMRVSGIMLDADPMSSVDVPVLDVESIQLLSGDTAQNAVTGNEKWVNVACRFGDMPDETPQPLEYFQGFMVNDIPGMDHYWRQTSSDLVNIEGSASYGWYNLPHDKQYYVTMSALNIPLALSSLMIDCTSAAVEADDVDFEQFAGINMMLNDTFGCCAWGGGMTLPINGKSVNFRATWLPPWGYTSLHVIAHEMGHGWGLPHSSGPYDAVYDSAWDIMSGGTREMDLCRIGHTEYGCVQVGTIGFHLDMLGWIPAERVVTVNSGESATVVLDALTTVRAGVDKLLVKIPIDQSGGNFYTVEVRSFVGYDRNVPGEAVVLHHVEPGRASPAHVVDGDNNGDPNDEGAMWLPGESFIDSNAAITVEVLNRLGTTFTVRVSNMDG